MRPADSTMLLSWCAPMNFWTSNTSRHKRRTATSQRRGPVQTERPLPTAALKLRSIPRTCPPPSTVQVAVTTALHCGGSMMQVLSLRLACAVEHFGATIDHASTFCVIRRAFPRCRARVTPPCGSGIGRSRQPMPAQQGLSVLRTSCGSDANVQHHPTPLAAPTRGTRPLPAPHPACPRLHAAWLVLHYCAAPRAICLLRSLPPRRQSMPPRMTLPLAAASPRHSRAALVALRFAGLGLG